MRAHIHRRALPEGADAVALQEDARRDGDWIELSAAVGSGENVRRIGIDFADGEVLLHAGDRLTPAALRSPPQPTTPRSRVAVFRA